MPVETPPRRSAFEAGRVSPAHPPPARGATRRSVHRAPPTVYAPGVVLIEFEARAPTRD
jgi:hypothetical protein